MGQLAATLDLSFCGALTGKPESLGQLTTLTSLKLEACGVLSLPLVCFHVRTPLLGLSQSLVFTPLISAKRGMPAINTFLLMHHYPLKLLILIISSRRRRMRVRVEWRCATSCSSDGVSRQSLLTPGALAAVPPCLCGGWSCVSRDAVAPCALPRLTAL